MAAQILDNVIWEYDKSTRLVGLLTQKDNWYTENHDKFWNSWFSSVFDLSGNDDLPNFGIVIWAFILNQPLEIFAPLFDEQPWGVGPNRQSFSAGNFTGSGNMAVSLTKHEKIQVLRATYFRYISNGTIPFINFAMRKVFGKDGLVYVADRQDMTLEYVFKYNLSTNMKAMLEGYNVLPTVAGHKQIITVSP
ncbi:hypothetical protein [Burkholderia phage BCSR129]|nr:hypothetical protein [Burkholderia phage BCSR129]